MNDDAAGSAGPPDPDRGLDVDAAWADIVARWGPAPEVPAAKTPPVEDEPADRRTDDGAEDEHFVPPPPPPLPQVEPRRRLAWIGLFGTPILALVMVALGVQVSGWIGFLMAVAFVGGFSYLVATMGSSRPDDWSGDDGAVL
jgi:hypothetical protein